jgi:glycosyltransferase involved in cell wall biosynthesis
MPRLVQISFSAIPDDPRVRRHNDALKNLGWDVVGLGYGGGRSSPPDWPIIDIAPQMTAEGAATQGGNIAPKANFGKQARRLVWFTLAAPLGLAVFMCGMIVSVFHAPRGQNLKARAKIIWTDIGWPVRVVRRLKSKPILTSEQAMRALEERLPVNAMIEAGQQIGPADIWVANDWTALPVANALQAKFGGHIVYDSHEFGTEENAQDWGWRKYERPITVAIEREFIAKAKVVTAVSDGIATALKALYGTSAPYERVINAPPFQNFAAATSPIKLLYHGIVVPGRGLELLIDAASLWGNGATLTIRGPARPDYHDALSQRIARQGLQDKVQILPPVPMTDLVHAARAFDVGIMALPDHSQQNQFALPNKIFEYLGAGLGLIVSDLPEMRAIVTTTQTGLVLTSQNPKMVAQSIANITLDQVNSWKQAAKEAATIYNGQASAAILDRLYRAVLASEA